MTKVLIIKNGVCDVDRSLTNILVDASLKSDRKILREDVKVVMSLNLTKMGTAEDIAKQFDMIVVCGGQQTLVDRLNPDYYHPYLNTLIDYIKVWIELNVKVLGICLGAQIIGEACGCTTKHLPSPVIGFGKSIRFLCSNDSAVLDRTFNSLSRYFITCHYDFVDIKSDTLEIEAVLENEDFVTPYAFRVKNAYGVQFHPEIDSDTFYQISNLCPDMYKERKFYDENCELIKTASIEFMTRILNATYSRVYPK